MVSFLRSARSCNRVVSGDDCKLRIVCNVTERGCTVSLKGLRRRPRRFVRPDQEDAVLLMRKRLRQLRVRYPEAYFFLAAAVVPPRGR